MKKAFEIGGILAAVVLVAFGVAAIVMGAQGRNTVSNNLREQKIVGTPDMTPAGIRAEATKSGLDVSKLTALGWKARIPLEDGLRDTYRWYVEQGKPLG